jgi:hypothetical protein
MAFHTNNPARRGAEARRIRERLTRHAELTAKYMDEGMSRDTASQRAYREITGALRARRRTK